MRILIAGLGAIGQRHARNLRTLRGDGVELLAYRQRRLKQVITESLSSDASRDVEEELGVTTFDDLDAALAARPDAVFICTPSSQHVAIAQRAADAGCHLFIEKPVSNTLDGVGQLLQSVADRKLIAVVGCQWRFHPCVIALHVLLTTRSLGDVRSAELDYADYLPDWHPYEDYRTSYAARAELGGGVVLTQIHDYDLAFWLFGAPRAVRAAGGHLSDLEVDVEDTVDATLETMTASVRVRQTFAHGPPRRTITVRGTAATASLDLLAASLVVQPQVAPGREVADYQRNQMFLSEATHFLDCIEGNASAVAPLVDGAVVLGVALAVKEAMKSGRTVQLT